MAQLSKKNLGKPTSIKWENLNPKLYDVSMEVAQAWEVKWKWYYNFPGAIQEAKALGKKLPKITELLQHLNSVDGSFEDRTKSLWISLQGYYDNDAISESCKISGEQFIELIWSSSPDSNDEENARCACINSKEPIPFATSDWALRNQGLSVRLIE